MIKPAPTFSRRVRLSMTAIAGAVAVTGAAFMAFFATVRDQVVTGIDVKVQGPVFVNPLSKLNDKRISISTRQSTAVAR